MKKPRRNGRRSLYIGTSKLVNFRMGDPMYAVLCAAAFDQGLDVSEYIREAIEKRLIAERRNVPRVTVQ